MDSHFEVIVLGTGLAESIVAAALAKAGHKVAHVDANPYYGGAEASLTTKELRDFISRISAKADDNGSFSSALLRGELPTSSRDYLISLRPSIIPSRGPLISALIGSGVARYGGFKLLESMSVYTNDGFKSVPGSKEEIFKSKELSLIDKRRLMRFLMFANGEFESSTELQGKENMPFLSFLREVFTLNEQLASALAHALALCRSASDTTLPALERIRHYLRSAGRYGPSPFLVGQYGGLGELAQGFCRVCAVSGGTYILGRDISSVKSVAPSSSGPSDLKSFRIKLLDIPDELASDLIVSSAEYLPLFIASGQALVQASEKYAYAIVLVNGGISRLSYSQSSSSEGEGETEQEQEGIADNEGESRPVDAALLVFTPGELVSGKACGPVHVLVNGEGTLSCPCGTSLLYLATTILADSAQEVTSDPERLLRPYLDATLSLLRTLDGTSLKEISSAFYIKSTPSLSEADIDSLKGRKIVISSSFQDCIADAGDRAATSAESLFRTVLKQLGREDAENAEFWPPLPAGLDDDDDDLI